MPFWHSLWQPEYELLIVSISTMTVSMIRRQVLIAPPSYTHARRASPMVMVELINLDAAGLDGQSELWYWFEWRGTDGMVVSS